MMAWINDSDRRQYRDEGYMAIRNVIPASLAVSAARSVAAFVGADLNNRDTWYGGAPALDGACRCTIRRRSGRSGSIRIYTIYTRFSRNSLRTPICWWMSIAAFSVRPSTRVSR